MRISQLPGMNVFGQGEQNLKIAYLNNPSNKFAFKRHITYTIGGVKPTKAMLTYRSIMVTVETLQVKI